MASISIVVNGKAREIAGPTGLVDFLTKHDIPTGMIAIAHNGQILRREDWAQVCLQAGDRVEIVHMVGGGGTSAERLSTQHSALSTQHSPDVVVVGGGIVGLATAFFLTKAGARVLVLEQEAIGCAASGSAAGMVSPFAEVDGPASLEALAHDGLRLHQTLALALLAETGIDVQFGPLAVIGPAFDPEDAAALQARLRRAPATTTLRWLTGAEARSLEPRLSPAAIGALYAPDEAQVDSYRVVLALAQAFERRGGRIRHGQVVGLLREKGRVRGVAMPDEQIACDRVILAAGPWTGLMADWIGQPIPVEPLRGQLLRLRVPEPPLRCCLLYRGGYVLRKGDGLTIAGTTEEPVGFRARTTARGRAAVVAAMLRLAPTLGEAAVVGHTACLRPRSADDLPILGSVPEWEGLYLATGHGRRGILLGPISGRLLADLVLGARTPASLEAFAPRRFAPAVVTGG